MALTKAALVKRARNIRLLAMDVDGVLTAGDIIVLESGEEIKLWNAKDRMAFASIRSQKIPLILAWITGRASKSVSSNAENLGIPHVVQKCEDKKSALEKILTERGLSFDQAAFIGDDLIDLRVMQHVGFSACPADAVPDVKKISNYVSAIDGGRGVGRDVVEFILKAQNKWDGVIRAFTA
jgi:3-deoxy-D-manno-octulosonate 8-phosphate phosphatase (KDO 8-P phosphatase)